MRVRYRNYRIDCTSQGGLGMSERPDRYDVVIVGASIAGCTAATLYGRSGLRVALLERSSDPQSFKRMCTHIIQPSAEPTIARLGLERELATAGGVRPAAALWTRWGW